MQWSDLLAAVALLLVFEGLVPCLRPSAVRSFARALESLNDRQLRLAGFLSMLGGAILLSVVR